MAREYLQRLAALIHDPATLAPPVQAQMVVELRNALHEEDDPTVLEDVRTLLRRLRRRPDVTDSIASELDSILGTDVADLSGIASPPRPDELIGSDRSEAIASAEPSPGTQPESADAGRTQAEAKSDTHRTRGVEDDARDTGATAPAGLDAAAGSDEANAPKSEELGGAARVPVPLWQRLTSRRKILVTAVAVIAMAVAAVGYRGFRTRKPVIRPNSSPERNAKPQFRVRQSITDLQNQYTAGNKKPLEDLWRAWIGIEQRPADDPRSFFTLAGYHGEPFRGPGATDAQYWGGYCQHGNVLFPTWHRVYVLKLEDALRSVPGCRDVTLPYWDETSADSLENGIPWALTRRTVELDGKTIPNPLRSFVFNADVVDNLKGDNVDYSKPKGYETVRYPLSGLVGTSDTSATTAHNAQYPDYDHNVALLNQNITHWLAGTELINGQPDREGQITDRYRTCLDAPNYTVFSNKTSATQWNQDNAHPGQLVESLEVPHAGIHLAIGGFDVPNQTDRSPIEGANGDMGENETTAFDPIFFFHHCFVDRVFWLWQQRHGATDKLDIIAGYPGTSSSDFQGATPGMAAGTPLTLETPLYPFTKADGTPYTSADCVNIEKLGIAYGSGSLQGPPAPRTTTGQDSRVIAVSGINPANIHGSFLVSAFGTTGGERVHLGTEAVLSHWNVSACANCHTHDELKAFFGVPPAATGLMRAATEDMLAETSSYAVEVRTRERVIHPRESGTPRAPESRSTADIHDQPDFRFEIR